MSQTSHTDGGAERAQQWKIFLLSLPSQILKRLRLPDNNNQRCYYQLPGVLGLQLWGIWEGNANVCFFFLGGGELVCVYEILASRCPEFKRAIRLSAFIRRQPLALGLDLVSLEWRRFSGRHRLPQLLSSEDKIHLLSNCRKFNLLTRTGSIGPDTEANMSVGIGLRPG